MRRDSEKWRGQNLVQFFPCKFFIEVIDEAGYPE